MIESVTSAMMANLSEKQVGASAYDPGLLAVPPAPDGMNFFTVH